MARALLSVRQARHRGLRPRARRLGVEIVSTGGTARELARRRPCRSARSRTTRASRRSWTGASRRCTRKRLRRPAGACATTPSTRARPPSTASSSIDLVVREPLPVRAHDGRDAACRRRRGDREHRHRRPDDDPRRGQEPRVRRGRRRPRELRRRARGAAQHRRRPLDGRRARRWRREAFAYTARYDTAISRWFAERAERRSRDLCVRAVREGRLDLRYGENPHQRAASTREAGARAAPARRCVRSSHGKELSFNNLLDLDSARRARSRVRACRLRDRQAQQPVRRRRRRRRARRPTSARSPATR